MTTYVFTSITGNYIPKARVLAESVKSHGEDVRFCLLLAEEGRGGASPWPEVDEVVRLGDLEIPALRSWVFGHELVELCTAVKGAFLVRLLQRPDCDQVFYFDPDIVVLSPLSVLSEELRAGSILLTPHLTEPESTTEAILDNEVAALRHGVYNLGFLAVKNDAAGRRFADWWWDRLRQFCRDDIPRGFFTDQRWVDLAPAYFEAVRIVRDPGWNVATWNLGRRTIRGDLASGLTSNGRPVRFYHFSGLDSGAQLAMLDKYGRDMPALYELRKWYLQRCEALGGPGDEEGADWSLGRFDDGRPIRPVHRHVYRQRTDLQQAFPDPFDTADVNASYADWFRVNWGAAPGAAEDESERHLELEICRQELLSIRSSRSWRLVQLLRKWFGPSYRALYRGFR
jgi:hypothetical protein